MSEWIEKPLGELAAIRVSNVDKKSLPLEHPIRLCNYMDVYAGLYLNDEVEYMEATASGREIANFALQTGDVIITKDSESPDDIGIPAIIDQTSGGLVCGYHLAILRPDRSKVDPLFLLKQIETDAVRRYYLKRAAGSTRYALATGTIEATPIKVAPLGSQRAMSRILRALDTKIEATEALLAKQEKVRAGLMQDLFTRGVDEHGQLRPPREEAPDLYHKTELGWLPKGWEAPLLDSVANRVSGHTPNRLKPEYWNGGVKWVSLADSSRLDRPFISETTHEISTLGIQNSSARLLPAGTVFVSRDAGVGKSAIMAVPMAVSQHFIGWICGGKLNHLFLYYFLQINKSMFENIATGSTIVTIGLGFFRRMRVVRPSDVDEQVKIARVLKAVDDRLDEEKNTLCKLRLQKSGLMQDLLTGKVPVAPLLEGVTA